MPPWPEWQIEYVGSSFLGKLLGLWCGFWISVLKRLFFILEHLLRIRTHTTVLAPAFRHSQFVQSCTG
jgi:hypothetical protein